MSILTRENDRKGLLGTVLFHVLLFLVLLITGFGSADPIDTDNGGVTVSFGEPDEGGDDNRSAASEAESTPPPASSSEESVVTSEDDAPEVTTSPVPKPRTETKPNNETKPTEQTQETKPSIDPRLKAQLEKMRKAKEAGGGEGDGPNPGSEGRPDGSEDGEPDGTGSGNLGNGISYKGFKGFNISGKPVITNERQNSGTVILQVCVSKSGSIIKIILERESTTNDTYLVEISKKAVRQLSIKPSGSNITDTNCGKITFIYEQS